MVPVSAVATKEEGKVLAALLMAPDEMALEDEF